MALKIEFAQNANVLIATCYGVHTPTTDDEMDRRGANECRARGLSKVIVDQRPFTAEQRGVMATYDAGTSLREYGITPDMQIVFIDFEAFRAENEQYRMIARNRGWNVSHAYSLEAALALLGVGGDEPTSPTGGST